MTAPSLPAGTDHRNGDFIAIFFDELGCRFIDTQPNQIVGAFPLGTLRKGEMQNPKSIFLRLVFDDQCINTHIRHVQSSLPTGIGFFDSSCEWRFPTYRNSICGGKHVTHQQTGCKDELIPRTEWIAFGIHLVEQDAR
jgi:hypothetical protein